MFNLVVDPWLVEAACVKLGWHMVFHDGGTCCLERIPEHVGVSINIEVREESGCQISYRLFQGVEICAFPQMYISPWKLFPCYQCTSFMNTMS